jgi:proteasome accessory factor B
VAGLAKLDLDPGAGPDALRANLDGASPLLAVLLEAVSGRKRIVFSYRPPGRDLAERRLDPYALVNRRGTWYVVGHDADRDALRSFRVSRIASDIRKLRPASRGADSRGPGRLRPRSSCPPPASPRGADGAGPAARATGPAGRAARGVPTARPGPTAW